MRAHTRILEAVMRARADDGGKRRTCARTVGHPVNRRNWLKTASGLVVGSPSTGCRSQADRQQVWPAATPARRSEGVDSFLSIHTDGSVTV
jgi:hypothetical protein